MGYPQHIHEHYWSIHSFRVLRWNILGSFGIIEWKEKNIFFYLWCGIGSLPWNWQSHKSVLWSVLFLTQSSFVLPKKMYTDKLVEINEKGHIIVSSWLSSSVLSEIIQAGLKRKKVFNGQNWIIIISMHWNVCIIFSLVWTGDRYVLFHLLESTCN